MDSNIMLKLDWITGLIPVIKTKIQVKSYWSGNPFFAKYSS